MDWFYAQGERQVGPVDDGELGRLAAAGTVTPVTLVWHGGLAEWQPYAVARGVPPSAPPALLPAGSPETFGGFSAPGPTPFAGGQTQCCSQCGRVLPQDDVVAIANFPVCAACKPMLVARLREGAPVFSLLGGPLPYAGFWIRLCAAILDGLILSPVWLLAGLLYFYFLRHSLSEAMSHPEGSEMMALQMTQVAGSLVGRVALAFYSAFCVSRFGATPGKRICGLRVIRGDGERCSFGRALGRYFAEIISSAILYMGYLFVAFDREKRALHDMICDTRVVYHQPR